MVEFVTSVYLGLMFISIYMMSFFIILTVKNRKRLFSYPKPNLGYNISVIVPAFNEEESIEETIRNVMACDYPMNNFQVIVVNDGSTDKTKEIVGRLLKKYSNLELLNKKNSGKADSLNQAIKIANGDLIAVTDADSFPSKESLKKLTGYFDDKKVAAVTSFVSVRNKEGNLYGKVQALEYMIMGWNRKLLDFIDSVYVTNGPLSLYRKDYVVKVGGFDKDSITEDIDITWNLLSKGYKTGMCLDARVSTVVPTTFKKWFRQRVRWGIGGIQALKKYKHKFLRRGLFGRFVMPFVFLSIFLSIGGFAFSSYILGKAFLTRILTTGYSIASNISLFHMQEINLIPSVMIFYFIILFFSSLIYYRYVLTKTKFYNRITFGRFLNLIFYMLVFLAFYPIIWYATFYRYLKKDFRW
ncbi:MAG: glycosyltransferase family 2 protein [Nanoarchaeota archaeon]|nr:glycosyltransferase family 2 protein [Nanoarchaeota archaeon]MBU1027571.1 glycosyltransferase family 2 protein [Nanoarchaeota archaeon]